MLKTPLIFVIVNMFYTFNLAFAAQDTTRLNTHYNCVTNGAPIYNENKLMNREGEDLNLDITDSSTSSIIALGSNYDYMIWPRKMWNATKKGITILKRNYGFNSEIRNIDMGGVEKKSAELGPFEVDSGGIKKTIQCTVTLEIVETK